MKDRHPLLPRESIKALVLSTAGCAAIVLFMIWPKPSPRAGNFATPFLAGLFVIGAIGLLIGIALLSLLTTVIRFVLSKDPETRARLCRVAAVYVLCVALPLVVFPTARMLLSVRHTWERTNASARIDHLRSCLGTRSSEEQCVASYLSGTRGKELGEAIRIIVMHARGSPQVLSSLARAVESGDCPVRTCLTSGLSFHDATHLDFFEQIGHRLSDGPLAELAVIGLYSQPYSDRRRMLLSSWANRLMTSDDSKARDASVATFSMLRMPGPSRR